MFLDKTTNDIIPVIKFILIIINLTFNYSSLFCIVFSPWQFRHKATKLLT